MWGRLWVPREQETGSTTAGRTLMVAPLSPPRALHLSVSACLQQQVGPKGGRPMFWEGMHVNARSSLGQGQHEAQFPRSPAAHRRSVPGPPALMPACHWGLRRCRRTHKMSCHWAPLLTPLCLPVSSLQLAARPPGPRRPQPRGGEQYRTSGLGGPSVSTLGSTRQALSHSSPRQPWSSGGLRRHWLLALPLQGLRVSRLGPRRGGR